MTSTSEERTGRSWSFRLNGNQVNGLTCSSPSASILVQQQVSIRVRSSSQKLTVSLWGAGTRLLAYDLQEPRRLWEDAADSGFWGWRRHGDTIVMSAELELAAWTLEGNKLWSTFVEPPWLYEVRGSRVHLDVMGEKSVFELRRGPASKGAG